MGRFDKRKKLEHLLEAHKLMKRSDIGLILVGPDNDGSLQSNKGGNVFLLGPIYGDERFELLSASDVYCLPGLVGLSIVDAFYCGLPLVTEEGVHAPEIMYLKDGVNGFIVPEGDIQQLMFKLLLLCEDDKMREKFSREARAEIMTNGHIETMCKGFNQAIEYVS